MSEKKKNSIVARAEAKADAMQKSKEKAKKDKAKGVKSSNAVVKYFKDLKSEFKKVVWPTKKKVLHNTLVVLIGMSACAIFVWGIDSGLGALIKLATNIG